MNCFLIPVETYGCIPSQAKVKLENGKITMISELLMGDKVQTGKYICKF